jgi:hypothetical protein
MDTKKRKAEYMKAYTKLNADRLSTYQKERYRRDKEKIALRKNKYRQNNKELVKKQKAESYLRNKEKVISKSKAYYANNKETLKATKRKYRLSDKGRFKTYLKSASVRGYIFELSFDEFVNIIKQECHYCGQIPANGVDRKDNTFGYTIKNSLPCCCKCNLMKRDTQYDEFIAQVENIYKHFNN